MDRCISLLDYIDARLVFHDHTFTTNGISMLSHSRKLIASVGASPRLTTGTHANVTPIRTEPGTPSFRPSLSRRIRAIRVNPPLALFTLSEVEGSEARPDSEVGVEGW
jgi:hypothetical protein